MRRLAARRAITRMSKSLETSVSIRWVFPFLRVTGQSPDNLEILAREGVGMREVVDPDTRISHRAIMALLASALRRERDLTLGLRAGERIEAGDYDMLEFASRSCNSLGEAILCICRYQLLLHGGLAARLVDEPGTAAWQWRVVDGVEQLPAANDFALLSAWSVMRRYAGELGDLQEVHFLHAAPPYRDAYARTFAGATLKFGMPQNGLVFPPAWLAAPLSHAHLGMHAAYDLRARAAMDQLMRGEGVAGRVRRVLVGRLRAGDFGVEAVARSLALSVTTLRRRLSEEGTSHRELLDEVRRELAETYLADLSIAIGEVAFLLGFAHVTAFYRAFQRWFSGSTPKAFRARLKRG